MKSFNTWLAVKITSLVGSMWCAYVFCLIALISLPATLATHNAVLIVQWIAQTFLQLVLLSIIIVGQNTQAEQQEKRMKAILNMIEGQQKEEIQELRDDREILNRELLLLRKKK